MKPTIGFIIGAILTAILTYLTKLVLFRSEIKFESNKDMIVRRRVAFQNMIHLITYIENIKDGNIDESSTSREWEIILKENDPNRLFFPEEMESEVDSVISNIYKIKGGKETINSVDFTSFKTLKEKIFDFQRREMKKIGKGGIFPFFG